MDGMNHPTHLISAWLCSDGSFYYESGNRAAEDPSGDALRAWVRGLLYGSQSALEREDRHTVAQVRDGISSNDFELLVDWTAIRHDLLDV